MLRVSIKEIRLICKTCKTQKRLQLNMVFTVNAEYISDINPFKTKVSFLKPSENIKSLVF